MKRKMHYQVQAPEIVAPRGGQVQSVQEGVREEIQNFLQALDSYPARVAKDPGVSFHQHLCSFLHGRSQ